MNLSQRKTPVGRADLLLLLENISHVHRVPMTGNGPGSVNYLVTR